MAFEINVISFTLIFLYFIESCYFSNNIWIFAPKIDMYKVCWFWSVLSEYSLFYPSMDKRARIWGTLTSLLTFPSHRSFFQEAFRISNGWLSIFFLSWKSLGIQSSASLTSLQKKREIKYRCAMHDAFPTENMHTRRLLPSLLSDVSSGLPLLWCKCSPVM